MTTRRPRPEPDDAQQLRARARELAALNDLALRLASVLDVDALLQETVTQARRLLDVDIAYLAMAGADGTLTIEVTEGSMGPQLRGIVLQPRSGLAGRVVERGEPVQSTDYLTDTGLSHLPSVDRAAAAEGLRSILGAPLRLRGEVIGVLMVAQRSLRAFTAGETSLLASLASLAAVAIDNARQVEEYQRSLAALGEANAALTGQLAALDELLSIALRGGGPQEAVAALSTSTGEPVSYAATGAALDPAAAQLAVQAGEVRYGTLQVAAESELWQRAAQVLALVVSTQRAAGDAERRTVAELLETLLTRRVGDEARFARRLKPKGFSLGTQHMVAVIDPVAADGGRAQARWAAFAGAHGGLAGQVLGHLVCVVAAQPQAVRDFAAEAGPATVGLAGPAAGAAAIAAAYDEALACLSVLYGLDRAGGVAAAADLGPFRYLLSTAGRADAQRFIQVTVGALLEQDSLRQTELARTAETFLSTGRHHQHTATALRIHANTLYQRLERIGGLLGAGWRDGDRALEVQLALRLHRLSADTTWGAHH